jgi:hypothetical protein
MRGKLILKNPSPALRAPSPTRGEGILKKVFLLYVAIF